jgi:hypothetical protein
MLQIDWSCCALHVICAVRLLELEKSPIAFNNKNSGTIKVTSIKANRLNSLASFPLRLLVEMKPGRFGCWTDHVHRNSVVIAAQKISHVPRMFGGETQLTTSGGSVQFGLNIAMLRIRILTGYRRKYFRKAYTKMLLYGAKRQDS